MNENIFYYMAIILIIIIFGVLLYDPIKNTYKQNKVKNKLFLEIEDFIKKRKKIDIQKIKTKEEIKYYYY